MNKISLWLHKYIDVAIWEARWAAIALANCRVQLCSTSLLTPFNEKTSYAYNKCDILVVMWTLVVCLKHMHLQSGPVGPYAHAYISSKSLNHVHVLYK